jgi:hypothetical protein
VVREEIIKGCELFDVFSEDMIREVASMGIPLNHNKGQILFNFDDPANNFLR